MDIAVFLAVTVFAFIALVTLVKFIYDYNKEEDHEPKMIDGFYNGDSSSPTNETIERWQRERDAYLEDPYEKDPNTGLVRLKYNPMGICTVYTREGHKLYEWHRPETDPMYYSFYPNEKPSYTAIPCDVINLTSRSFSGCSAFMCNPCHATGEKYVKSSDGPHFDASLKRWK